MKNKILTFFSAVVYFLAPSLVWARDYGLPATAQETGYKTNVSVFSIVGQVVGAGLAMIAVVFVVIIVYAGIRWMTARDNEEFVKKAKNAMEAAVIGLAITIAAYAITTFIFGSVGA